MRRAVAIGILFFLAACAPAEAVTYTGKNLRDPFRGIAKPEAVKAKEAPKAPTLVLQGLLWNAEPPKAIISGKVVEVGDTVVGVQVLSIDREGVTVFQGEKEIFLSRKGGVKK